MLNDERMICVSICILSLLATILPARIALAVRFDQESVVSFKAVNKPLGSVINLISEQTGYLVTIDEEFSSVIVYGEYNNVTIDQFFRRVLRDQNVSVLISEQEKRITVRFFGEKGHRNYLTSTASGNLARVTKEKIKAQHEKQYAELEAILNDPQAVDPQSGMKLTQIRMKNQEQKEELARIKKDPESVDPQSGMKLIEIAEKNKQQQASLDKVNSEPALVIDSDTGQTRAELQLRHEGQKKEFQDFINSYIDPETDESVADIKARHERQVKELALY